MSADKVLRLDLLDAIEDAVNQSTLGGNVYKIYRTHHVMIAASPSGWARFTVMGREIEFTQPYKKVSDTLRALRDLDYLIDILNAVNEPALKGN